MRASWWTALLLAAPGTAFADPRDPGSCEREFFPIDEARVVGTDRAAFTHSPAYCSDSPVRCTRSAYVVPGDRLLIGVQAGAYACASYIGHHAVTRGWIALARLERIGAPPTLRDWAGEWEGDGTQSIEFQPAGNRLKVTGTAFYQMRDERGRPIPGGVNDGMLEETGTPEGRRLLIGSNGEYECRVEFSLIGETLYARDNNRCGGLNVSFTGDYTRAHRQARKQRRH